MRCCSTAPSHRPPHCRLLKHLWCSPHIPIQPPLALMMGPPLHWRAQQRTPMKPIMLMRADTLSFRPGVKRAAAMLCSSPAPAAPRQSGAAPDGIGPFDKRSADTFNCQDMSAKRSQLLVSLLPWLRKLLSQLGGVSVQLQSCDPSKCKYTLTQCLHGKSYIFQCGPKKWE